MAALMTGSAKIRANTNVSSPPTAPASTPRRMSFFSMPGLPAGGLVAGEAEEVPGVVDELVDVHVVAGHRQRALVHSDEVVDRQRQEEGGGQPQRRPRQRQHDRSGCGT